MNNVTVIGNLGGDPELTFTPKGTAKVKFSVADTREYEGKKETTWHRCVAWGKTAENIASTFAKGQRVILLGQYKTDEYTTKAGEKKSVMELLVSDCGHSIRFELPNDNRPKFSDNLGSGDGGLIDEEPF